MRIEGYIYGENNQLIKATIMLVDPANGVQAEEILPGEKYVIDEPEFSGDWVVIFSSFGYKSFKTTIADLQSSGSNIHLEKSNNTVVLLLIALGLLYAFSNRKKSVGRFQATDVIPFLIIAGAVLGFSFIKQFLEKLGIWDSRDTKQLDETETTADNWWNPNFYKTKPAHVAYTNPITKSRADQLAKYLYDQFNFLNDDEDSAIAVFKSLPSQAAGSFLSESFRDIYGVDMLSWLRGGIWPQDRLSDADVNTINRYMMTLPKY